MKSQSFGRDAPSPSNGRFLFLSEQLGVFFSEVPGIFDQLPLEFREALFGGGIFPLGEPVDHQIVDLRTVVLDVPVVVQVGGDFGGLEVKDFRPASCGGVDEILSCPQVDFKVSGALCVAPEEG